MLWGDRNEKEQERNVDRTAPIAGGSTSHPPGATPAAAGKAGTAVAPRLGPMQKWGNEPGLDTAWPVVPDDDVRYIVQWHDYFRTDQTTYNAWVHAAHPEEPDWARMTKVQYLAALPFPGPRTFDEVADKAPDTEKKPAETVYPKHYPWA